MSENENMELTQQEETREPKKEKEKKVEKKPGIFARIGRWLREMRAELKKVQWPTTKQTVNNTLIVLGCVLLVGVFIWLFDLIAGGLIRALIALFS